MVHFALVLRDGIKDAWYAVTDILFQDVLAEQDGQQDADGGTDEVKNMGVVELRIDDQVADTVSQLFNDNSGRTGEESRRDAEYQHKPTVGHVRRPPCVEAVNPSVELVFKRHFGHFAAAKIGKSNAQRKKK